jgi:hypothetical protein
LGNIKHRDNIVSSEIMKLLQDWNVNYQNKKDITTSPSSEELAMIEEFKQKGWV